MTTRPKAFLVMGVDPSSVYHSTLDCPAITGRIGWRGQVVTARLQEDGSQRVGSGFWSGTYRRRPCKRCHASDD